jgi:UDP-4-amino-4,6-dideoxy-N-acetyl-beta-L-altrosamine N-acetyltransferase
MNKFEDYVLSDVSKEHKNMILNWRNAEHVRKNMFNEHVITKEDHDRWFENLEMDKKIIGKILLYKGAPIGFVNFTDLDYKNNKGYWGFYIGERKTPKGSGKVMALLALDYIFEEYKLKKLCSQILEFNEISIRYHLKIGFSEEGRLKQHIFKNNNYYDVIEMALFRKDWAHIRKKLLKELKGNKDKKKTASES